MSPSVLGKTIQVGTKWVTIVGVTPPEFIGLQVGFPIDVTIPITLADGTQSPQSWWLSVVGRLQDGATVEQARADLDAMFQAYMTDHGVSGRVLQPHRARARGQGTERYPPAAGAAAAGRHGDRRHRAPDRLRKRREPSAGAWERAAKRNRGAAGDRRRQRQADPADAHGGSGAGGARNRGRDSLCPVGRRVSRGRVRGRPRRPRAGAAVRPAGARVHGRCRGGDGPPVQRPAGAARHPRRRGEAGGQRSYLDTWRKASRGAGPGRDSGHAVAGAPVAGRRCSFAPCTTSPRSTAASTARTC